MRAISLRLLLAGMATAFVILSYACANWRYSNDATISTRKNEQAAEYRRLARIVFARPASEIIARLGLSAPIAASHYDDYHFEFVIHEGGGVTGSVPLLDRSIGSAGYLGFLTDNDAEIVRQLIGELTSTRPGMLIEVDGEPAYKYIRAYNYHPDSIYIWDTTTTATARLLAIIQRSVEPEYAEVFRLYDLPAPPSIDDPTPYGACEVHNLQLQKGHATLNMSCMAWDSLDDSPRASDFPHSNPAVTGGYAPMKPYERLVLCCRACRRSEIAWRDANPGNTLDSLDVPRPLLN